MKPCASRIRIGGLVVLALGVAIGSAAQWHPGAAVAGEAPDRGSMWQQVIKLRVQVALLQLEHEAARNTLLQFLNEEGEIDLHQGKGEQSTKLTADFLKSDADSDAAAERISRMELEARRDALRAKVGRRKKEFLERAERLTEKKLELAELEARYQLPK